MMKTIIRLTTIVGMLALSGAAFAYSIVPGDAGWSGSLPSNPDGYDVECIVAGGNTYDPPPPPTGAFNGWTTDCGGNLDELYKADVGNPDAPATIESGSFAGNYTTTFSNDALDPADADIAYDGPSAIGCSDSDPCYLVVKDGNQDPIWYIFDISDWNGTDTIEMRGFWPLRGAISHVAIYGGGTTDMPEPGTLGLLGLGLFGMGLLRRRRMS